MDNLLSNQLIDFIDYLERIPKEMIPQKAELISKIKEKQQMIDNQAEYEQMASWLDKQSPEIQQQIINMPAEQQEQAVRELMYQ